LLAARNRRLVEIGDDEANQRLTVARVSTIFPGTSVRTIKRKMKEMRETKGEAVLRNPPVLPQSQVSLRNAGVEVSDKLPLNRKDVEIINALRQKAD
jgi:hypothetical protein